MIEFLTFGNVTVAYFILLVVVLLGMAVYWFLSSTFNFMLNSDHENSKVKLDTKKGFKLFNKIPKIGKPFYVVKADDSDYVIKNMVGDYYDKSDGRFWSRPFYSSYFSTKEDAINTMKTLPCSNIYTLLVFIVFTIIADIIILLFPMAPVLTSSVIILFCVVFGVRKMSGFLWSNISQTENHEDRISKLEEDK